MKVFKKVFAFAIALTAIAMASSAMAATGNATYDSDNHTFAADVDVTGITSQATVAVVPTTFGENEADAADVYYINQDTPAAIAGELANGVGLKTADIAFVPSAFEVRVGGNGKATYDTYRIPAYDVNVNSAVIDTRVEGEAGSIGFDGSITLSGVELNNLKFYLTTSDTAEGIQANAVVSTADAEKVNFTKAASISGTVTFGLEVKGVPAGVTVGLTKVEVE